MKLTGTIAFFSLGVMVKSTWWAAALQPVILSLVSVFAVTDQDVLDIHLIDWGKWLPFINTTKKTTPAAEEEPVPKKEEMAKPTEADGDPAEDSTRDKDLTDEEEKVIITIGEELEGLRKEYKETYPNGIYSKHEMFRVLEKDDESEVKKTSMV